MQKVLDDKPYVILGPVFSGSVLVTCCSRRHAEIPEIIGGEAAAITQKGNPYVFRTSFGQQFSMPKIANYIRDGLKAKTVAVVWVNNDFGKGGRDNFVKEMASRGIKVVADLSTESGQADFSADVVKLKAANADVIFVYTNEEESARFLKEAKKQGISAPIIGETTLLSQKVIELAGDAADGVQGHVGLSADAPVPALKEFAEKFKKRFNYVNDHNGIKGYTAVYVIKYVTEKMGKFDSKRFAETLHGMTITPEEEPAYPDGSHLGQERRHRPRELPRRGRRRQAEDRRGPAEARQVRLIVLEIFRPAGSPGGSQTGGPMASFIQLLVSGLATGAIYALIAVGFTLLWQTSQTINFAQGEFVMVPAFFMLEAMYLGAPFWLAALIGIALSVLMLGFLFKLIIVDPMLKHGVLPLVISTIALSLFMREAAKDFYSSQAQPFPAAGAADRHPFSSARCSRRRAWRCWRWPSRTWWRCTSCSPRPGSAARMQATAQNPKLARISRHPGAADGALHLPHQCRAVAIASILISPIYLAKFTNGETLGMAAFVAAIIGGFNQVRGAILGGILLGVLDNLSAAYLSAHISRRLSAAHPDRRHPVPSAGAARPRRGAHGMNRFGAIAVACRGALRRCAAALSQALRHLPRSIWAVLTIAALGLNLTLGYAGQISLAQGAFVGIGAYTVALLTQAGVPYPSPSSPAALLCFSIGWVLGYPALRVQHHYLAFVTLAFTTLVFLVLRNEEWLTNGIYGINGIARPRLFGWSTDGALTFLLLLPRHAGRPGGLAPGGCSARPGGAPSWRCAKTRCARCRWARYAPLHADGLRHRLEPWRAVGRALCAAGPVHRAELLRARAIAQSAADGDRRRQRLLLRPVRRRADRRAAAGMAAVHAGLLPLVYAALVMVMMAFCPYGMLGLLEPHVQGGRRRSEPPAPVRAAGRGRAMTAVLEVSNLRKSFGGITAVDGVSFDVQRR